MDGLAFSNMLNTLGCFGVLVPVMISSMSQVDELEDLFNVDEHQLDRTVFGDPNLCGS